MEEKVYYQNGDILVTPSRFVNAGKTYAMRNISSVQIGVIEPQGKGVLILGILICFLVLLYGSLGWKVGAVAVSLLLVYLFRKMKQKYSVRINSNSGEVDGLISQNREYIQTIVNAMNGAISHPVQ